MNRIRDRKMVKIHVHIDKSRLKSNRDPKAPRIPIEGSTSNIHRIDSTERFDTISSFENTPEKLGTIGRSGIFPNINVAIFQFQNINPDSVIIV